MENEYKLLCGFTYDDVKHTTFTLKEMTGVEQEQIHKADVKNNGAKIIHRLLAYCVTSIGSLTPKDFGGVLKWEKEVIRNLYAGDIDYILIALRKLSIGEEIEITHTCPECGSKLKTVFNLDELDVEEFKGSEEVDFVLPKGYVDKKGTVHTEGTMKLPKGLDREIVMPVARKNVAQAETMLLTRMCTFKDGYPMDDSVMRALTIKDRKYLTELMKDNSFGVNLEVSVTCSDCGEEYKVSLTEVADDFFI